jgi:hypothetical protein
MQTLLLNCIRSLAIFREVRKVLPPDVRMAPACPGRASERGAAEHPVLPCACILPVVYRPTPLGSAFGWSPTRDGRGSGMTPQAPRVHANWSPAGRCGRAPLTPDVAGAKVIEFATMPSPRPPRGRSCHE